VHSGAIEFLSSARYTNAIKFVLTNKDCDELVNTLFQDRDWTHRVFGKYKVNKYTMSALFLQLIATEILEFESSADGTVECVFFCDAKGEYNYLNKLNWEGFIFRTKSSNKVLGFAQ